MAIAQGKEAETIQELMDGRKKMDNQLSRIKKQHSQIVNIQREINEHHEKIKELHEKLISLKNELRRIWRDDNPLSPDSDNVE
jgi:archaellum component FlaC